MAAPYANPTSSIFIQMSFIANHCFFYSSIFPSSPHQNACITPSSRSLYNTTGPSTSSPQTSKMSPSLPSPAPSTLTITSSSTSCPVTVLSKVTVFPDKKSKLGDLLNLSVFDLPMLTCHYIQKGLLFPPPSIPIASVRTLLTLSLSRALSFFPSLAGRLFTDPEGRIFISCTDSGAEFTHATATSLTLPLLLPPFLRRPHSI
ncbi:hypothetical protein HPP92_019207 [Vanilla planifolia]|uniref:Uncharacterized protein n=1 Tax=Vanilla planifolia TaxID=51239 RepID=A0A835QEG5_VANPL|nr:hypothetical protein HPP92_019207 [Vanilla planifolia]